MMRWLRGAILAALFVGAVSPAVADGPAGQPWINGSNQLYVRGAPSGLSVLPSLMPAFTGGDCNSSVNSVSLSCPGLGKLTGNQTWSGNNTFTGAVIGPYGTLPGSGTNGQVYTTSGGFYAYYAGAWHGPFSTTGLNPNAPTPTTFTSGTNASYPTPAGASWLDVTLIGAGGGGAGGGTAGGVAGNGGSTYWNTSSPASTSPIATAGGGTGGQGANYAGASGATFSGTCPGNSAGPSAAGGGSQGGSASTNGGISGVGGVGGASSAGGGGASNSGAGQAPGSGGGGGASGNGVSAIAGAGGAAGATCRLIISSPAATYYYTVGTGGSAGAAGTGGVAGGAGAGGSVTIVPHFNP